MNRRNGASPKRSAETTEIVTQLSLALSCAPETIVSAAKDCGMVCTASESASLRAGLHSKLDHVLDRLNRLMS